MGHIKLWLLKDTRNAYANLIGCIITGHEWTGYEMDSGGPG